VSSWGRDCDDGGVMSPSLLVVCHANVTRSVAAASLLRASLPPTFAIRTGGTHAVDGQPVSTRTREALGALASAAEVTGHRSRLLDDGDLDWADLVLTMEASQVRWLRQRYPSSAPKVGLLAFVARALPRGPSPLTERIAAMQLELEEPFDVDDVIDPAGGEADAYESTIEVLVTTCAALADRLVS